MAASPRSPTLIAVPMIALLASTLLAEADSWRYRFEPAEGITSAGQPNEQGFTELAESGYAAVIDLRTAEEDRGLDEQATVESLGMDYISLPIAGKAAVNFENASKLDRILDQYQRPVLIHCTSANRVGALLALRAKLNGADDDEAIAFGVAAGMTNLEETVKARLADR